MMPFRKFHPDGQRIAKNAFLTGLLFWTFSGVTTARGTETSVDSLLEGYRAVSWSLAYDKYAETQSRAKAMAAVCSRWLEANPAHPRRNAVKSLHEGMTLLSLTTEEGKLRQRMALAARGALELIRPDESLRTKWQLYYCSMVKLYWVQPVTEAMANPYMGTQMLKCGVKKKWTALPGN